jgi:hypothetical protein
MQCQILNPSAQKENETAALTQVAQRKQKNNSLIAITDLSNHFAKPSRCDFPMSQTQVREEHVNAALRER